MSFKSVDGQLEHAKQLCTHIFPPAGAATLERVHEGVSTYVYRVVWKHEVFYLRVLPEQDASFAPEALVHRLLRERGLHVPEVVYFEHYNPALQHSVMVTTEIKGRAIGYGVDPIVVKDVLVAAGRELAIINSVNVEHFGWIRRDNAEVSQLRAELPTYRAFIQRDVLEYLVLLGERNVLSLEEADAIQAILTRCDAYLDVDQAYLAHGDFDATHIYHQDGRYTGIIDFGEIRGADALYDLAHFKLNNADLLPYLLVGYRDVTPLPVDYEQRIRFGSLLIGLRRFGRRVMRRPEGYQSDPDLRSIQEDMRALG